MPLAFREGFVRVLGHRTYWKSIGAPQKGSILCLHGGPGMDHWSTLPMADLAPLGYRVVMYDQFGCGRSERPRSYRGYTLDRVADEADALRRALRLGRCHLWGYSFGAALALETVVRHPRRFRSLVVSSGWASQRQLDREIVRLVGALPPRLRRAIEENEARGRLKNPGYRRALAEFFRRHLSRSRVPPFEIAIGLANQNRAIPAALFGKDERLLSPASGAMAGWDVRRELPRIRVPTLVTVGDGEHVTPRCARTIHRGIPGSRLVVFRDSGHAYLFRQRDRYMALVADFLASVPKSGNARGARGDRRPALAGRRGRSRAATAPGGRAHAHARRTAYL